LAASRAGGEARAENLNDFDMMQNRASNNPACHGQYSDRNVVLNDVQARKWYDCIVAV
jgi:hypothetical protein